MGEPKLEVELTLEQARIITTALDFYSRIHIGQIHEVEQLIRMYDIKKHPEQALDYQAIEEHITTIKNEMGFERNESFGIFSDKINPIAIKAYDIQQAIRHMEAWTRAGKDPAVDSRTGDMMQVSYDEPLYGYYKEPIRVTAIKHRKKESNAKL